MEALRFSPDGQFVSAITAGGSFFTWSLRTRRQVSFEAYETSFPRAAALSGNHRLAMAQGLDGGNWIQVFDTRDGKELHGLEGTQDSDLRAIALSGEGSLLAAIADKGPPWLWDLSRKPRVRKLRGAKGRLRVVAVSEDGTRTVAAGEDGFVYVWNSRTGRLLKTLRGGERSIVSVAVSADGRWVLAGSEDAQARLWDLRTGKQVWSMEEEAIPIGAVALSGDGTRAVTSGKELQLWDLQQGSVLAESSSGPSPVVLSADNAFIAAGGYDAMWLMDTRSGHRFEFSLNGQMDAIAALVVSPDGKRAASSSQSASVRLWDMAGGTAQELASGREQPPMAVAFSQDGRKLLSASRDGLVRLWDPREPSTGRTLVKLPPEPTVLVTSPAGPYAVLSGSDGALRLWNLEEEKEVRRYGEEGGPAYYPVVFSADGKRLFAAREEHGVDVWEVETGQQVKRLEPSGYEVTSFAASGEVVAAGTRDGHIQLWKAQTLEPLFRLSGHEYGIRTVSLSGDGKWVLSVGEDWTVRLWDAKTGAQQAALGPQSNYDLPASAVFEPGGQSFLVGDNAGVIHRFVFEGQ
ncbi:WD-repeat protein, putative [Stigmatella aurantiaca DW4/3-1]|uniref:WD-repeat protein, putative n=1 Tax=Stigmatella aurantiaca (strain DW4/3-1) TaxID=378806 RepID=Q09AF9_STIAD|nr:WD-repeat protein, putative [Stigmatella aurantiaca DW4/3-1]